MKWTPELIDRLEMYPEEFSHEDLQDLAKHVRDLENQIQTQYTRACLAENREERWEGTLRGGI